MIENYCPDCGRTYYRVSSLQNRCGLCTKNLGAKTPLKRVGKVTKRWIATRNQWIKDNPPTHQGYYTCGICGSSVHIDEMTLDHIEPRSRRPDLRHDPENLSPTHYLCNSEKGSK